MDPELNPHFDARMGIDKNKLLRPKRMTFQFVEEGKWSKEAEMMKLKVHFATFFILCRSLLSIVCLFLLFLPANLRINLEKKEQKT